jgi:pyruvate formate lyase activating enzyme
MIENADSRALQGTIFDIQRFALHDGPGIRTTVFFKGCPLHCLWCSNPESQQSQPQLAFIAKNCAHCLACTTVCPSGAHYAEGNIHRWESNRCRSCFKCVAVCPHDALRQIGRFMTVEEIMAILRKDRLYYEKSGGGLTLSGGEPLAQPEFSLALLRQAKAEGFHTCIETAGYALLSVLAEFSEVVDLFLYDLKLFDDDLHRAYTGVSGDLIFANLEWLCHHHEAIVLRCPIIQQINDSDDHFTGIARLMQRFPNIQAVEVMPFHDYGRSKATDVGMTWKIEQNSVDDDQALRWVARLQELGCRNARLG